ncbi:MAG: CDP-diacylglycerol diphosphatase [Pseudomonadota bacterium]|nr:CDP-diacylglycerol diphosphatase [Pseudomonadota bacterium]
MNAKAQLFMAVFAAAAIAFASSVAGGSSQHAQSSAESSSTYSPELGTGRGALRQIVQDKCVVNWSQHHDPAPCERVFLADSKTGNSGYAVIADRKGGAHFLLVPTQTMAGIESRELLDPDAPNYFAEAWHARDLIARLLGHAVARTAIGLAVNTARSRSQDQFHVHIECLRQDVVDSLHTAAEHVTDTWSPVNVAGSTYSALRIMGEGLDGSNPFELLATLTPEVRYHMGDYTLVAAGMQFRTGPGFIVLTGTGRTGELLLDSGCAVAGAGG